jgi:hypothetical protein
MLKSVVLTSAGVAVQFIPVFGTYQIRKWLILPTSFTDFFVVFLSIIVNDGMINLDSCFIQTQHSLSYSLAILPFTIIEVKKE